MVGGVETSCHTRLPSLNYAGSNVQPSVITHSLTQSQLIASWVGEGKTSANSLPYVCMYDFCIDLRHIPYDCMIFVLISGITVA